MRLKGRRTARVSFLANQSPNGSIHVNILQQISSILPACGPKRTNFYASKTPIDPHFVANSLKIIDCVTSLGRTELKGTHPLKQLKAGSGRLGPLGDQGPDELQRIVILILAGDGRSDRLRGAFHRDAKQAGHVGGAWYCGPLRHMAGDA